MSLIQTFSAAKEEALSQEFLEKGYLIRDVSDRAALDSLRSEVVKCVCEQLQISPPKDENKFLNEIHSVLPVAKLNDIRLGTYNRLNSQSWFRPTYFGLGREVLEAVVGNELAMQNKVNLSIQYPNDESSLLGVHADAWSGETPYQVVLWLPLVDVYETKSMYILDPETNRSVGARMKELSEKGGSATLYEAYKDRFVWLKVPYGKSLVFSPILLHGNIVNRTPETRWSFNCRFTGLFTPYASQEKTLGNFYLPITTKVVSRIGMNYSNPTGFNE